MKLGTLAALLALGGPGVAAEPTAPGAPPSFALIVGTNHGGPGQRDLRFAEEDARHVAELLGSLGRYAPEEVELMLRPRRLDVERALDRLAARAAAAGGRGGEVQALFYYSGHARASALNLGDEELPIDDLRARLTALPATVTIVLLDACQSGAISRIKGAAPTLDFSFNSVSGLDTAGIAVMASSSGTELSQESEALRSSYFTHHLLVGLRGAGDADHDGRVTLAEAYRYAYNQTLTATAATAVGSQHATLETGLRGKGEVVLTYPAQARSQLELPAALAGEVLVRVEPAGTVVAEMHKVEGYPVRLALPAGRYEALHRQGARVRRCDIALSDGQVVVLDAADCADVAPVAVAVKGADTAARLTAAPDRFIALRMAFGALASRDDRFVQRLGDFGFQDQVAFGLPRLSLAGVRGVDRHVALGMEIASLDDRVFRRHSDATMLSGQDERFSWTTYSLGWFVEGRYPLWRDHVVPYARAGIGFSYSHSSYQEIDVASRAVLSDDRTTHVGYSLRAGTGVAVMFWRYGGAFVEANATHAPAAVSNRLGDAHDGGGLGLLLGMEVAK